MLAFIPCSTTYNLLLNIIVNFFRGQQCTNVRPYRQSFYLFTFLPLISPLKKESLIGDADRDRRLVIVLAFEEAFRVLGLDSNLS